MDRFDDEICIEFQEWSTVAHAASFLPVKQDFPQSDGVFVNFLQFLEVFSAR